MKSSVLFATILAAITATLAPASIGAPKRPAVCLSCVTGNMQRLAGDALRGRGCGSVDENAAARFIAETLQHSKIAPAAGAETYMQAVELLTPTAAEPATFEITGGGIHITLTQGQDMVAVEAPEAAEGPVVRLTDVHAPPEMVRGKVIILDTPTYDPVGVLGLSRAGAVAVVVTANAMITSRWSEVAARPPGRTQIVGVARAAPTSAVTIFVRPETMDLLRPVTEGQARLTAPRGVPRSRTTYNVIGVLHGKAPDADQRAILLSAHYDHLGVRDGVIFHGANDDASGTAAVLEFARIFGAGPKRQRTVYFTLFGCEEEGAFGAQYFLAHPPMAITDLAANLEFEMIGVDDPSRPGALMLTGWERSNLGPTLQAHGARIGPDLYPQENFFRRSDNYQLALRGVVAQTVSAWPIPPTYHAATDDLAHVDLNFMASVIGSFVEPLTWLLDSDFMPAWNPGMRP